MPAALRAACVYVMNHPAPTPPTPRRTRLAVHLTIVLIVKVILLTLLWHAFIKPNKVKVDIDTMGTRITGSRITDSASQPPQEKANDRLDGR